MANKKLIGEYPAIGIWPIVDGRRGPMQLRESLEPQVMAMAEAAKKLFEDGRSAGVFAGEDGRGDVRLGRGGHLCHLVFYLCE